MMNNLVWVSRLLSEYYRCQALLWHIYTSRDVANEVQKAAGRCLHEGNKWAWQAEASLYVGEPEAKERMRRMKEAAQKEVKEILRPFAGYYGRFSTHSSEGHTELIYHERGWFEHRAVKKEPFETLPQIGDLLPYIDEEGKVVGDGTVFRVVEVKSEREEENSVQVYINLARQGD